MNSNRVALDFERYKLAVEIHGKEILQKGHDSVTGRATEQTWTQGRRLGYGAFGDVHQHERKDKHNDIHYRAVKKCSIENMEKGGIDYKRELLALAAFSESKYSGFFVNFHGWWIDSYHVFIAMEYLSYGDLSEHVTIGVPEVDIKEITDNVLRGLEVMHHYGIAHRDIKPKNILVVQRKPEHRRWWVKIADFGISKQVSGKSATGLWSNVGTDQYRAPEITGVIAQDLDTYDNKVDMWSLGCVIFNVSSRGQVPFADFLELLWYCDGRAAFNQRNLALSLNGDGITFTKALLQVRPNQRLSATAALQHTWLTTAVDTTTSNTDTIFSPRPRRDSPPQPPATQSSVVSDQTTLVTRRRLQDHKFLDESEQQVLQQLVEQEQDETNETTMRNNQQLAHYEDDSPSRFSTSVKRAPIANETAQSTPVSVPMMFGNDDTRPLDTPSPPPFRDTEINSTQRSAKPSHLRGTSLSGRMLGETISSNSAVSASGKSDRLVNLGNSIHNPKSPKTAEEDVRSLGQLQQAGTSQFNRSWPSTSRYNYAYSATSENNVIKPSYLSPPAPIRPTETVVASPLRDPLSSGNVLRDWLEKNRDMLRKGKKSSGITSLHLAAEQGEVEIAIYLLELDDDIDAKSRSGRTPLHFAAQHGQLEMVKCLKEQGANMEEVNGLGWTPLYAAAMKGQLEVVKCLKEQGADIDARDGEDRTPLHIASLKGQLEVVIWLREQGADIESRDSDGQTPLCLAVEGHRLEVAEWLKEQGANINARDNDGLNLLHRNVYHGRLEVAKWLMGQGVDIHTRGNKGMTSLHFAADRGELDTAMWLKEQGAYIKARDDDGQTPLHIAVQHGRLEMAQWLKDQDTDINRKDKKGRAPLHIAIERGQDDIAGWLMDQGADVDAETYEGLTPLGLAEEVEFEQGTNSVIAARLRKRMDNLARVPMGRGGGGTGEPSEEQKRDLVKERAREPATKRTRELMEDQMRQKELKQMFKRADGRPRSPMRELSEEHSTEQDMQLPGQHRPELTEAQMREQSLKLFKLNWERMRQEAAKRPGARSWEVPEPRSRTADDPMVESSGEQRTVSMMDRPRRYMVTPPEVQVKEQNLELKEEQSRQKSEEFAESRKQVLQMAGASIKEPLGEQKDEAARPRVSYNERQTMGRFIQNIEKAAEIRSREQTSKQRLEIAGQPIMDLVREQRGEVAGQRTSTVSELKMREDSLKLRKEQLRRVSLIIPQIRYKAQLQQRDETTEQRMKNVSEWQKFEQSLKLEEEQLKREIEELSETQLRAQQWAWGSQIAGTPMEEPSRQPIPRSSGNLYSDFSERSTPKDEQSSSKGSTMKRFKNWMQK